MDEQDANNLEVLTSVLHLIMHVLSTELAEKKAPMLLRGHRDCLVDAEKKTAGGFKGQIRSRTSFIKLSIVLL